MTVADIDSWTGVTPSIIACTRGNFFGIFKLISEYNFIFKKKSFIKKIFLITVYLIFF